jgi:FixJ family two-component response regulator
MTISQTPARPASDFIVAVVDDDENVLKALDALLQSADYSVRLFPTATAFLQSGCLVKIDCLISDIGLPAIDGFELSRKVAEARPALPVILITGRPDIVDRISDATCGHPRLFTKPFDAAALLVAVAAAMKRPGAAPPRA